MPINQLISILDKQLMLRFFVIIDFIDYYQFLLIINANQLTLIVIDWFSYLMRFIFSQDFQKDGRLLMHFNDENCDKTLFFFIMAINT